MQLALQWRGSVASKIFPGILLCGGLGVVVSLFDYFGFSVSWKGFDILITNVSYNLVLGLLLVFRTNSAYASYWEGRKGWGTITASIRSLGHLIWVAIAEAEPKDREGKVSALRLLVACAIAIKLQLRQQPINSELEVLITQEQLLHLKAVKSTSLQLAVWVGDYLQQQYNRKLVSVNQLTAMNGLVNDMLGSLTTCERILSTPIPLAYAIYLKRLLLIYCISLPFQVVNTLHWWTSPIVVILSFVLLGVEEIGTEIENPFGDDANDLPLDEICATISQDIEDLIRVNSQKQLSINNTELELTPHSSSVGLPN
ncbi:bestrophin family protein [Allocoleopsis sp.]|uniref:bestrophin family protein n=1 Tax=Allocoleopsis sp. TaxID=3088169 RepID=UPI002FD4A2FD